MIKNAESVSAIHLETKLTFITHIMLLIIEFWCKNIKILKNEETNRHRHIFTIARVKKLFLEGQSSLYDQKIMKN